MAYIESHEELENHPKVIDLESRMRWSRDETIGKLHRFWWWCLKYAPTGNLTKFNDGQLAGAVVLNVADGKKFVEAMIASRWIDRGGNIFRVHDWPRYAGTYLRGSKFKREPARWQETLDLYELTCEFDEAKKRPETVAGQSRVTNQTNKQTTAEKGVCDFENFWHAYPVTERKGDKEKCLKRWESKNLAAEVDAIAIGLKAWKQSETWLKDDGKYICAPLVWLNNRRWENKITVVPRVNEIGMPILTREEVLEKLGEVESCKVP